MYRIDSSCISASNQKLKFIIKTLYLTLKNIKNTYLYWLLFINHIKLIIMIVIDIFGRFYC